MNIRAAHKIGKDRKTWVTAEYAFLYPIFFIHYYELPHSEQEMCIMYIVKQCDSYRTVARYKPTCNIVNFGKTVKSENFQML
jgi:hypothetical protein